MAAPIRAVKSTVLLQFLRDLIPDVQAQTCLAHLGPEFNMTANNYDEMRKAQGFTLLYLTGLRGQSHLHLHYEAHTLFLI